MKRLPLYCFLFFFTLCQVSWAADSHDTALFILRGDAFWTTFASHTKTASEDIGLNIKVYNADENRQTMLDQVQQARQKGVGAIVFMNYQGIGEAILQIAEKHKTPAFLDNTTFKDKAFAPRKKYRCWTGELAADDMYAGTLLARRLSEIAEIEKFL